MEHVGRSAYASGMWTYYRVAGGGLVRVDLESRVAEEFDPAESAWLEMDAWYDEIQFNGQGELVAGRRG